MRKITFVLYIFSIIFLGVLGAWIGAYAYKINSIGMVEVPVLEGMENKDLEKELALIVNERVDIVSPNATLLIKKSYSECGHEITESEQINSDYVNLTKEEFEREFLKDNENFIIENFSSKEIVVLEEIDAACNQHYLLRANNGVVVVYKYDRNGVLTVYENTNIGTEYLTDADRLELEKGIEVIGNGELSSRLEDYV